MTPDPVLAYARAVVKGKVPAGLLHRAACQRHLRDMDERKAKGWTWDRAAAVRAIEFFPATLLHFKGQWAGKPVALEPWQQFIVGSLCGWKRADNGLRRFRTCFVEVPRGNGKSMMVAGLALYLNFFDGEAGSEAYAIANKKDQARDIVWEYAKQMVSRTPALKRRIHVAACSMYVSETASRFVPLGADSATLDGLRPHVVVADEIHKMRDHRLLGVMTTGMTTRLQPAMIEITTAGVYRNGPWWAHREYSRLQLDGLADDPAWFCMVIGADPDDDWTDEAIWKKANPNFGISINPDAMRADCQRAKAMPAFENEFRMLYVGQLVEQMERVIPRVQWDACRRDVDLAAYRGRPCVGGLDLSTTTDLSAFVLVFGEPDGGYTALPWFWVPEDNITERVQRDRVPYDQWVRQGLIETTPGNVTDYDYLRSSINRLAQEFAVGEIAYDPWNATQLAVQLQGDGLQMVQCRQGFKTLSEPTKRLIALVAGQELRQPGHDVLTWCLDNLTVAKDPAGNLRPDKGKATERIDGAVALIMALSRAFVAVSGASVYEERGLIAL